MAWGLWNKIKKGFKKAGKVFKKGAQFINDKVIKPFKPLIKSAADSFIPGSGAIIDKVSDGIDTVVNNDWSKARNSVSEWAKQRFKPY